MTREQWNGPWCHVCDTGVDSLGNGHMLTCSRRAARCNDTAPVAPIGDDRNATIEECAFVAEHGGIFGVVIAARIRKLKGQ